MTSYEEMRSALITARSALVDLSYSGVVDTETYKAEIEVIDKALALPRRNCDVGTAEEQYAIWDKHCLSISEKCSECSLNKDYQDLTAKCFAKWAQMPYEEGGKK